MSRNDEFINGHEHDSLHVIYTFQNMTCQLHVVFLMHYFGQRRKL